MADAVSAAAREMSRRRWGDTRVRALVAELEQRAEQLTEANRDRLRVLAGPVESED